MALPLSTSLLFSYGTLRQRDVQIATFGHELDGRPDAIVGYELDWVTITDAHVIAASGSDRHPILRPTTRADAAVFFSLTERIRIQGNVENLFNRTYYTNADSNTNISPGFPRAVRVGIIARF